MINSYAYSADGLCGPRFYPDKSPHDVPGSVYSSLPGPVIKQILLLSISMEFICVKASLSLFSFWLSPSGSKIIPPSQKTFAPYLQPPPQQISILLSFLKNTKKKKFIVKKNPKLFGHHPFHKMNQVRYVQ